MALALEIPEEVVTAMGLSRAETHQELLKEVALALYTRGVLSAGKSAEVAGLTRLGFERLLCERQIVRSYSEEDLAHDLAWAKSHQNES